MQEPLCRQPAALLFDIDGTLMDTVPDLLDLTNRILDEFGEPLQTAATIKRLMGMDPRHRLIHLTLPKNASASERDHALELWERYFPEHQGLSKPFPGVVDALHALARQGCLLGAVSNKRQDAVEALCEKWFPGLMNVCVGRQQGVPVKPNPTMLLFAARRLNIDPEDIGYVGDTDTDMTAAHNASMQAIAVTWGFKDPTKFTGASLPDQIVSFPTQLAGVLLE